MAKLIQISIYDSKSQLGRTIPFLDTDPENIQVSINDKVIYRGKNYQPSPSDRIKRGKLPSKKKVKKNKKK
jgi:hypothetical protein